MIKIVSKVLVVIVVVCSAGVYYAFSQLDYEDMLEEYTLAPILEPEHGELTFQWLGNSTVLISDGKHSIMTDGWFTRLPMSEVIADLVTDMDAVKHSLARAEVDQLSAIIPIHSHYDHVMDTPAVAELTGAVLFGSESSANVGRGWGLPEEQIVVVGDKGAQQFGDFKVTLLRSKHFVYVPTAIAAHMHERNAEMYTHVGPGSVIEEPIVQPLGLLDYSEGGAYAILIEHPQATILINGSAGYVKDLLRDIKADILFLGVAGIAVQTKEYQKEYWREVVEMTQPSVIIPVHWDSFNHPLGDVPEAPNRLMDSIFANLDMKASVMWLMDKDESLFKPLLPMWQKVPLRQLLRTD